MSLKYLQRKLSYDRNKTDENLEINLERNIKNLYAKNFKSFLKAIKVVLKHVENYPLFSIR
jgi:hypothetical protein